LQDNGQLRPDGLIKISEIVGQANADIEDLFGLDFYLQLVNIAYANQLQQPITVADLNANIARVVKRIEDYFKVNDIDGGHFNHYRPATVLLQPGTVTGSLGADTLDMAEALFVKLNALLAS
jgi:hypothetical protein